MKKKIRFDTVILALLLFAVSGGILAYNIHTVKDGELAVSLYDLVDDAVPKSSAISTYTAANLTKDESVHTAGTPTEPPHEIAVSNELLPPIITPPVE